MTRAASMTLLLAFLLTLSGVVTWGQDAEGPPPDLDEQLRDIRGPVSYVGPTPWLRILSIAGGLAVAAACLAYAAVALVRRRGEAGEAERTAKPKVPPGETAARRLRELAKRRLWEEGNYDEFADELSAILRDFTGATVCPGAECRTTDELERELSAAANRGAVDAVKDLLMPCDLAKFAKLRGFETSPVDVALQWVQSVAPTSGGPPE